MDFAFWLFAALVITGGVILWDRLSLATTSETDRPVSKVVTIVIEYARAFFPVILVVFVLRSFIVELFRIPSGSMLPSLYIGDFILVSKFSYGIRLPLINQKIVSIATPERGDVMVFRYPHDQKTNFIKRVVGVPGDIIDYRGKQIWINGAAVPLESAKHHVLNDSGNRTTSVVEYQEQLGDKLHGVLLDESRSSRDMLRITVPEGQYFVMGDNRDHSNDSRFWGFVPDTNLVGRAFLVWFSWDTAGGGGVNWPRLGKTVE